jgi:DNA-binding NarL/FixJ family response regulator
MEAKVLIITQQAADPLLVKHLLGFGFLDEEIRTSTGVEEALTMPGEAIQLVLLQIDDTNGGALVQALYLRFTTAPIIILIEKKDEKNALELLQYGAQDYILLSEYSLRRFKQTINNAQCRKKFSYSYLNIIAN